MSISKSQAHQTQYPSYAQKSYLHQPKNNDLKDYKRYLGDNVSFEAKQTPTNPSLRATDLGDFSYNKNSSKSLNRDLKLADFGAGKTALGYEKKEKDADLSMKLKDKRELDYKLTKGSEKNKGVESLDSKYEKIMEKSKLKDTLFPKDKDFKDLGGFKRDFGLTKDKMKAEDVKLNTKYQNYLNESPEKISERKQKKMENLLRESPEKVSDRKLKKWLDDPKKNYNEGASFKKTYNEDLSLKKTYNEDLGAKKTYNENLGLKKTYNEDLGFKKTTFEVKKNIDFWNEKLEKYGQKEKKIEPPPQDFNFKQESDYIKQLKQSLNIKDTSKPTKAYDIDKKLKNFDDKGPLARNEGFKQEWALDFDEKPDKYTEKNKQTGTSYSKYDALSSKAMKPEISAKKPGTTETSYKDLVRPTTAEPKGRDFKFQQAYATPGPAAKPEIYEKKLIAEEKRVEEKKPLIYEKFDLDQEKEKLKKARENIEQKSFDSSSLEQLKKKKGELEIQVLDLTQKLDALKSSTNNSRQDLQDLEQKYKDSQKELYELKNKQEDAQRQITTMNNQMAEMKQNANKFEAEKQQLKASNEKLQRENQEILRLQAAIKEIKSEVSKEQKLKESLLNDLKLSEDRKRNLEISLREANGQMEDLKGFKDRWEKSEKARSDQNSQLKQMNEELTKLKRKFNEVGDVEALKEELERARSENAKSNKNNQHLQEQLQENTAKSELKQKGLLNEIDALKQNQEKLSVENRSLAEKIGALNEQYNHVLDEFSEKEQVYLNEIHELKSGAGGIPQEELLEIVRNFEEEKNYLIQNHEKLEKENIDLREQWKFNEKKSLEEAKKASKEWENRFKEEHSKYEGNQHKLQSELEKLTQEFQKILEANNRLTQENERILNEFDSLQGEFEVLHKIKADYEENLQKLQDDNTTMAQYIEKLEETKNHSPEVPDFSEKFEELELTHHKEVEALQKEIEELHQVRGNLEKILEDKVHSEEQFEERLALEKASLEEQLQNLKTKYDLVVQQLQEKSLNPISDGDHDLEEKLNEFQQKEQEYVGLIENLQNEHDEIFKELEAEKERAARIEAESNNHVKMLEKRIQEDGKRMETSERENLEKIKKLEDFEKASKEKIKQLEQNEKGAKEKVQFLEEELERLSAVKPPENARNEDFEVVEELNRYKTMIKEKEEKIDELVNDFTQREQMFKEANELMVQEYEEKHYNLLMHEKEKFEIIQEKFLKKIEALKQENEAFREHILNNPQMLENKENKIPKDNSEIQTIPFLVDEYELRYKMALDQEREKFKVIEEKYIKKVQDLQELIVNMNQAGL